MHGMARSALALSLLALLAVGAAARAVVPAVQQAVLSDPEAISGCYTCAGLALSRDGNTALVGVNIANESNIGGDTGYVSVYARVGGAWTREATLVPREGDAPYTAVAVSGDGNTALIGGFSNGTVYLFARVGGAWDERAALTPRDVTTPNIGQAYDSIDALALSEDGSTALIGMSYKKARVNNCTPGEAYVFARAGGVWTESPVPLRSGDCDQYDSPSNNDRFGRAVALSADGTVALIGAQGRNVGGNLAQGEAYVFARGNGGWSRQGAPLTPLNGAQLDAFGSAVALSSDGNTALIGSQQGAAYVFARAGQTWSQRAVLFYSLRDEEGRALWGKAVALSGDGTVALVGIIGRYTFESALGRVFVFAAEGAAWRQQGGALLGSDGSFGTRVALSGDGGLALIAGSYPTGGRNGLHGAVYVFGPGAAPQTTPTPGAPRSDIPGPGIIRRIGDG